MTSANIFDCCFPDKFKIDYAIVVSIIVTRFCNQAPWYLSVRNRKFLCELFGQFTQLQNAHGNGILINMRRKERFFVVLDRVQSFLNLIAVLSMCSIQFRFRAF